MADPNPFPTPINSSASVQGSLSSLPSVTARIVAFVAIILAGLCGGIIGWSAVGLQCSHSCRSQQSVGAVVSTMLFAGGTAIVSVLTLRALAEWKANK